MSKSLTLAGTGIKFLSHLTEETKTYIKECDKLLFLVNDPIFKQWIKQNKSNCETLDTIYHQLKDRLESYKAIAEYIIDDFTHYQHICVLIYGHPTVFSSIGLKAIQLAQDKGYGTKILPGISAENCLFADLGIDPASSGCQSFEATDFLIYHRKFDSDCHLILWQIDVIGLQEHSDKINYNGLKYLSDKLKEQYPHDHKVILYEAAQYPGLEAIIQKVPLNQLSEVTLTPVTTLYVPPTRKRVADLEVLSLLCPLGIDKG